MPQTQKRTGWIDHGVRISLRSQLESELKIRDRLADQRGRAPVRLNIMITCSPFAPFSSISDHMHRMAVLAMCTSDEKLDIAKYAAVVSQARISTDGREEQMRNDVCRS